MKLPTFILVFSATLTTAKELIGQQGGFHDPNSPLCLGQCWNAGKKNVFVRPRTHLPHFYLTTELKPSARRQQSPRMSLQRHVLARDGDLQPSMYVAFIPGILGEIEKLLM
jgi:hypothetical protein